MLCLSVLMIVYLERQLWPMLLLTETVTTALPGTLGTSPEQPDRLKRKGFFAPCFFPVCLANSPAYAKLALADAQRPFWLALMLIVTLVAILSLTVKIFIDRRMLARVLALQRKQAVDHERRRIAADIHDDLGAELTGIAILSQLLKHSLVADKEESLKLAEKIRDSSSQVITKMNEVVWALNAKDYTLKNLMAHIRSYINSLKENTGMGIIIQVGNNAQLNYPLRDELTGNVFLVIKEILQNAVKHSKAATIMLSLDLLPSLRLCIDYQDDGIGFDPAQAQSGNGLRNIHRRVKESGGLVEFLPVGKGSRIKVIVPITPSYEQP